MPTWVSPYVRGLWRCEAPPGLRADYKVSFLPGECLRISNKAAILSPFATDNEAAPRRWLLFVFCLLTNELVLRYTPSALLFVFVVLLHCSLPPSQGGPELFRGTQIHPVRVRGVPTSTRGGRGMCTIVDESQTWCKIPLLSLLPLFSAVPYSVFSRQKTLITSKVNVSLQFLLNIELIEESSFQRVVFPHVRRLRKRREEKRRELAHGRQLSTCEYKVKQIELMRMQFRVYRPETRTSSG